MSNWKNDNIPWFKTAIFYEISLKAFKDGNNDGIGDFKGLIQKLDYLKELGIDCIWILPFYPSPWRDDGYDVSDFCNIHPTFGTIEDFEELVFECQKRGLKIIGDLVINHTSDQHPWFQNAITAKDSAKRDYYVWSPTNTKYKGVRIIFQDIEESNWSFEPNTQEYYWHRFYSHQPDLNFENLEVQEEMIKVVDFWLDKGLDGFRIDAVPYLFQEEGTSCESLPRTHGFIQRLRKHIDQTYGVNNKIILAEANQMPEETITYFGDGTNEFQMVFHFPLMLRLYLALAKQDASSIKNILKRTKDTPLSCQWCTFLRNHDELTLEMGSDEVREFMWNFYAPELRMRLNLGIRRRLSPLMNNDLRKIKLLNSLLFSLPGSPIIWMGDEIGMGDNIYLNDRDSVRTPMQWSNEKNAGFSNANPDQLYLPVIDDPNYGPQEINVVNQLNDNSSLLNYLKNLIKMRKQYPSLALGQIRFIDTNHKGHFVFVREYLDQQILLVHNLTELSGECRITNHNLDGDLLKQIFPLEKKYSININSEIILKLTPFLKCWYLVK